jgi:hypothetical protein
MTFRLRKYGISALVLVICSIATPLFASLAHAQQASPQTPCDKYLTAATVSGLLAGRPALNRYSQTEDEAADGCQWGLSDGTNFAMVDFSIEPQVATAFTNIEQMYPSHKTLAGVGDHADEFPTKPSNIPNAVETDVMAQKGGIICYAQLHRSNGPAGAKFIVQQDDDKIAAQLGKLCSLGFASGS